MEREVFENPQIAPYMNEHFINIKVDREERPDLDELYMLATQMLTGSGGWPMSVWLTPGLKPFYAGTYFPPEDQYGRPGFPSVLSAITHAWRDQQPQVLEQADHVAQSIADHLNATPPPPARKEPLAWIDAALRESQRRIDLTWGGFSGAPKFPPHQTLLFWIALLQPSALSLLATPPITISPALIKTWLTTTLDRMAAGGIYDQIAGGFSRYSTDEQWLVPHFEKMLYDNAQLALIYAQAGVLLDRADYIRIATETLDFWLREMTGADGLFFSSLDADSEGVEGKFYVWSWQDILAAIPAEADRILAGEYWNLTPAGNWEGRNIPHVTAEVEQLATRHGQSPHLIQSRLHDIRQRMLDIRSTRIAPHCDDKILAGWNGLMIRALAEAALLLNEPRYYQAGVKAAASILKVHRDAEGNLLHVSRAGRADVPAFLEDYVGLGLATWSLATAAKRLAPGEEHIWIDTTRQMAQSAVENFYQSHTGRFFISSQRHEKLFVRVPSAGDNAVPSAAAMAITLLLKADSAVPGSTYPAIVERGLAALAPHIARFPLAFSTMLDTLVRHPHLMAPSGVAISSGGCGGGCCR